MIDENTRLNANQDALLFSCSACDAWVSSTKAIVTSGNDYPKHFCGPECHEHWISQEKKTERV